MDGSVRSGGVVKKKSSSGCLIIKKKVDNKNLGGGSGGLSVYNEEKKRPRVVESDSDSSDEDESLEFMRRKVNDKRLHNGATGHRRSELGSKEYHRNNVGIEIGGERKRSRLDLYDFDEYDEFDGKQVRNEYMEDRFKMVGRPGGRNLQEFGVGSSGRNVVAEKRKQSSYLDGSSSGRNKGIEHSGLRNKGHELEEDESHMPISLLRLKYQETATEPIRVQGKNGVLKVMVNKKKKMDAPSQHKNIDPREVEERKVSRYKDVQGKDILARTPVNPKGLKQPEKRGLLVDKEKTVVKEKKEVNLEKVKPISKGNKSTGLETDADTALKLAPPGIQVYSSKKAVKRVEETSAQPEDVTPVKGKEGKAKRGGSTEKQILREKIRGMLIDAGWTIDYRPRRNRDYLDAVYINPNGTAYWSIIKAYDAFKKHLKEDNDKANLDLGSPSIAPLSDDLINKLTRQTKKKIEAEMKRKRKEAGMTKSVKKPAIREAADSSDSDQDEERLSSYKKQTQKSQKGNLHEDRESGDGSSDDSPKRKPRKIRVEKTSNASNSNFVQGRTSKKIGRCTLLVRGTDRGDNSESDGYVPYSGKRTVLAWLIDSGTAHLSEKVQYMNRRRTRVMLEGWITRDGIHCGCCSKILTVSKFELHAGSKLRQPFQNIFLESGASLLQCQLDAWNRQDESARQDSHTVDVDGDDPDDDTCGICGDGGDLICCDSCPSTFHQICLGIQMLPSGDWHCPKCTCKFCGDANGDAAEANDCTSIELIRCSFCEKKYHKSCSEAVYMTSNGASFCGLECQELYDHVQKILGVKHELEAGFSWSLNQRSDVSDSSLRGFHLRVECNSKLAVALSVMDECFLPIIDRRSGINMIRNVVYNCGSNFNRLNYHGFYTAILERGDEIISAASIRIHGTRLAEMPFIGTREIYRRQGMCRRLFSAIETELCSLKVRQLIIPAISEHMNTWTTVFGFHQLEDALKKEIKSMNMLVFPGTDMLQKQLVKQEISDGMKVSASVVDQPQIRVSVEKSDNDSPVGHNGQLSDESKPCCDIKSTDGVSALGSSGSQSPVCERMTPFKSEVENIEKEPSAGLKSHSSPDEGNNASDMENRLLNTAEDNIESSVDVVMEDACKIEAPSSGETLNAADAITNQNPPVLESTESSNIEGRDSSPIKVSEDVTPQVTVNSGSVESLHASVVETSGKSTTDRVNDELTASLPTPVGVAESPPASVVETSAKNTTDRVNEELAASIPTPVGVEEPPPASMVETSAKNTTDRVNEELTASIPTPVGVVEPPPASLVEISAMNTTEIVHEELTAFIPTPLGVEELPPASVVETSAKNTTDRGSEELTASIPTPVGAVEPPPASLVEISAINTTDIVHEELTASIPTPLGVEELPPASVVETSAKNTTDRVSEELTASIPTPVGVVEPPPASVVETSAMNTTDIVHEELTPSIPTPLGVEELPPASVVETSAKNTTDRVSEELTASIPTPVVVEELPPASVVETSAKNTTDRVNKELTASLPTPVGVEEPPAQLETGASQPTGTVVERELNSSIEPSPGSQEVSPNDSVQAVKENHNHAPPMPNSPDIGKSITACNAEVDQKVADQIENGLAVSGAVQGAVNPAKTDTPNGETKMPNLDDGKVFSPISSSEASAHDTETTEIHTESNGFPDSNSAQP